MSTYYVLVVDIFENSAMSVAMTRFLEGLRFDAPHKMSDRIPIPTIKLLYTPVSRSDTASVRIPQILSFPTYNELSAFLSHLIPYSSSMTDFTISATVSW